MKTAVLYSGHMRSFARCLPTQIDHVFRHFPGADFFVSTIKDADSSTAELLREKFPKSRVEIEVLDCQPELPIPVPPIADDWVAGANRLYGHEPYAISVHPQAILRQLWHLARVWEFFKAKAQAARDTIPADGSVEGYAQVIRMRADNYFRSFRPAWPISPRIKAHFLLNPNSQGVAVIDSDKEYERKVALTPFWGRFGGVNDRFAVLGETAAQAYFTTFSRIGELLAKNYPLHPERLVYASLIESGCTVDDTLHAWFSKLIWDHGKDHGSFRDPEVTAVDHIHMTARP